MSDYLLFLILSIPVIYFSRKNLINVKTHGFYRFFAWECILWLLISNYKYWFTDPFSAYQIISWILLILGGYLAIAGVIIMKRLGKTSKSRKDDALYSFERTTELIDSGVFRHIRHPLYSSLIYLTWGIFFKHPGVILLIISVVASVLLYLTARQDEKECLSFFGTKYTDYMKSSKMFIPYLFSLGVLLMVPGLLQAQITQRAPSELSAVKPLADGQSKYLGCEWDYGQASGFSLYWNQVTPGNAGKWGSVERTRDVMNWTVLDSTYNVAKRNHMLFKEHTLIWGAQQPSWIGALDTASQRQEIEEWFAALAQRYDSIEYIDVVNEPIHNAPNGMVPWGTTVPNVDYARALGGAGATGWDWVIRAFRMARHYFPESKLILNEYSVINSTSKTQQYIGLINLLKAENLIDGIGEQAHAFTTYGASSTLLKSNLDQLAATGIPIHLTELDIDGLTDLSQLQEYQRVFPIFWEHPAVEGITLWGFRFGVWRQEQKAYLINENGTERPAMKWLKAYINDSLTLSDSIIVLPRTDTIYVGDQLQFGSQVLPANTTIPNVSWSMSPVALGSIKSNGVLTALAAGKATVRATAWDGSGVSGTAVITILKRLVQSVQITSTTGKDSVTVGETLQLTASVLPENASNKTVIWRITPENLATINETGLLTAISAGTVTVTALAADGSTITGIREIVIVDNATNIAGDNSFNHITIYPNPAFNGNFTITGTDNISVIEIFDSAGNLVLHKQHLRQSYIMINKAISPGVYMIRFSDGKSQFNKKIVIHY